MSGLNPAAVDFSKENSKEVSNVFLYLTFLQFVREYFIKCQMTNNL